MTGVAEICAGGSYVSPHAFAVRLQSTERVLDYRADLGAVWPEGIAALRVIVEAVRA